MVLGRGQHCDARRIGTGRNLRIGELPRPELIEIEGQGDKQQRRGQQEDERNADKVQKIAEAPGKGCGVRRR